MGWLCHENKTEIINLLKAHLTKSDRSDITDKKHIYMSREIFNGLQRVFDICKFWLHYFDQGMKSAWPDTRYAIPKSMRNLRKEIRNLMTAFRNPGCMMNETTLGEDLRKYG